jgi:predicted SprT family Zn-dependent metalloprotease
LGIGQTNPEAAVKQFTMETAMEMLELLSRHFAETGITFRWNRSRRGLHYFNPWKGLNEVTIPHPSRGRAFEVQEQSFLHEFCHAIVHARGGARGHGENFQELLFEIATVWYGDPLKYDWSREYTIIRRAAERKFKRSFRSRKLILNVVWNDTLGVWEPA